MSNNSIWPRNRTLSGAIALDQSEPVSDDNEEVLRFPQSSSITGALPSDCLMSYPEHTLTGLPLCRNAVGVLYSPA